MIDLNEFFSIQTRLLAQLPRQYSRFLRDEIDWDNRLVALTGGRGTGKTTMLLQHLDELDRSGQKHLYVSADHIRVQATGLYEIVSHFFRLGGKTIMLDEIHKYPNWHQEVKNLYDSFPTAKIYLSGSSTLALQKGKADLSRRAVFHHLPGLSFREYLDLTRGLHFQARSLSETLRNHAETASKILEKGPILGHFKDYLRHGVYPYILEGADEYHQRLRNTLEKVLYEDIPSAIGIKTSSVTQLKRILWLIATSQPFEPNIGRISSSLRISKEYVYTYIDALERAGLVSGILPSETGHRLVRKPSKLYLENTNLLKAITGALGAEEGIGTVRETFFVHQIKSANLNIRVSTKGDFLVEGKYVFEIGGKTKKGGQINGLDNAFLLRDDIEIGHGNVIPLWIFGFLY